MNKSLLNKILIVVVIAIWGYAFKGFFINKKATPTYIPPIVSVNKIETVIKDTFVLEKLNRDPFLGYLSKPKKVIHKKKTTPIKKKAYYRWPNIEYIGYLKNHNTGMESILLKVNKRLKKYHKEDKILDEINIDFISKDLIKLEAKGNLKEFVKR